MGIKCPLFLQGLCVLLTLLTVVITQKYKGFQCGCPIYSSCFNKTHCICDPGYASVSGKKFFDDLLESCEDINECAPPINKSCGLNAQCLNTGGSYVCSCFDGYEYNPLLNQSENTCHDINECQNNSSLCAPNGDCENTIGSYMCMCEPGFVEINEGEWKECTGENQLKNLSNSLELFINTELTAKNKTAIRTDVTKLLRNLEQAAWKDAFKFSDGKVQTVQNNSVLVVQTQVISNCSQKREIRLEAQNNSVNFSCTDIIHSNTQGHKAVAFLAYTSLGTIINASFFEEYENKSSEVYLNSQVVSTALGPSQSESSSFSVHLTFQHKQKKNAEEKSLCVYWEEEGGAWSTKGCTLSESNETHTSCNCNHLSSFAVLMSLNPQEEDCVLTMITYVGLSLSMLCLLLAALTFLLCRPIQNTSTSLHLQLSLCLFLADLLFLTGFKQTKHEVLCSIIAGLLHYLYLASFTWMLLEGLHLFLTARNLMVVNYSRANRSLKKVMYPLGYGIPAVIIAISASVRPDLYGTPSLCWLKLDKGFRWAFLGPVCTIICVNFSFFLLVLWILQSKLSSLNSEVSTIQDTRLLTFKAMAQLCILGCTWFLGLLQIVPAAWIMAYLFTIINSLQGVFIFLVYCLLNHQVQEQYKKWFETIRQRKPDTESLVLSSNVVSGSTQTNTEEDSKN